MDEQKATVTLVIGGARSGKSRHAEQLACALAPKPIYLATAEAFDEEMRTRIAMHRSRREVRFLRTVENRSTCRGTEGHRMRLPRRIVDCVTDCSGTFAP
jgi:adenosylcobinamide kinase/adenosylcobinamide-phosphate guanylyltransferase